MEPSIRSENSGNEYRYLVAGEWTVDHAEKCLSTSEMIVGHPRIHTVVQCGGMEHIDITGAWLLNRRIYALRASGADISLEGFKPEHLRAIERIGELYRRASAPLTPLRRPLWKQALDAVHRGGQSALNALEFLGWCLSVAGGTLKHPSRFRYDSFVKQCESAAVRAAPIVALISFLIAMVTAYQGSAQLKRFGAEVFSINLVTITMLREMGVLLTAIMLAGRSGSAFAAEIGTMKLNQELDALKTTGLNPMEVLVLPRILAMTVMTPLLAFMADMMGLLGSGVFSVFNGSGNWLLYTSRLSWAVRMPDFWIGMSKAPVFGLLIGIVGCYHGLAVTNSAESVGKETTNAVVIAIFLVLCADAFFSVFYTLLDL